LPGDGCEADVSEPDSVWCHEGYDEERTDDNGRAVFEFFEDGGETKVRWLRIGGHEIYNEV
jgi:hypothetical protein